MLDVGNLVNAGGSDPLLATIVTMDPVHVYFSVDERALQRYQKAGADDSFGRADRRAEGPQDALPLRAGDRRRVPQHGHAGLRRQPRRSDDRDDPGARRRAQPAVAVSCRGRASASACRSATSSQASLVPDTAILSDQDRKYVLVRGRQERRAAPRHLALGKLLDDGMRIVLPGTAANPGIAPSDTIMTQGLQAARINYPVEPVKPTTQPARGRAVDGPSRGAVA